MEAKNRLDSQRGEQHAIRMMLFVEREYARDGFSSCVMSNWFQALESAYVKLIKDEKGKQRVVINWILERSLDLRDKASAAGLDLKKVDEYHVEFITQRMTWFAPIEDALAGFVYPVDQSKEEALNQLESALVLWKGINPRYIFQEERELLEQLMEEVHLAEHCLSDEQCAFLEELLPKGTFKL